MEKKMTFEEAMKKLEAINNQLQNNDCPLDDAIELYKEGLKLAEFCEKKLNNISEQLDKLSMEKTND